MAQYAKEFLLTNSLTELDLGLSGAETLQISNASYTNTSAAGLTVTLNRASDGSAAATGNVLENGKALGSKATSGSALTGKNIIPGGKLYGSASTTGVVVLAIDGTVTTEEARSW